MPLGCGLPMPVTPGAGRGARALVTPSLDVGVRPPGRTSLIARVAKGVYYRDYALVRPPARRRGLSARPLGRHPFVGRAAELARAAGAVGTVGLAEAAGAVGAIGLARAAGAVGTVGLAGADGGAGRARGDEGLHPGRPVLQSLHGRQGVRQVVHRGDEDVSQGARVRVRRG